MKKLYALALASLLALPVVAQPLALAAPASHHAKEASKVSLKGVLQPGKSPIVSLRFVFRTGSAQDPPGKEGVAALTAAMITQGGSRTLSYEGFIDKMYPMATSFSAQVDKEMTVFEGETHRDNLEAYYALVSSQMLDPGWRESDFERLRDEALSYLKGDLGSNNDEELGKEVLYNFIYKGHPYGHNNHGRIESLQNLTLEDVKAFYRQHYLFSNLTLGVAGGYPVNFPAKVVADLRGRLAPGSEPPVGLPAPTPSVGRRLLVVQKDTRSTAISLGFPIRINRSSPDFPALWMASMWLGEHRSDNSHLYQRMRELRGLNYGDYAYVEYFPSGMFLTEPEPNQARQQQIFQIWIRPVEPLNAHFALRNAVFELDKMIHFGIPADEFEVTREYLIRYVDLLVKSQDTRLGYALDSRFYGIPEWAPYMREQLKALTRDKVNAVIRKYLTTEELRVVIVAPNGAELVKAIGGDAPSPIQYNASKPAEVLAEDKIIEKLPLKLPSDHIQMIRTDEALR